MSILQMEERLVVLRKLFFSCSASLKDHEIGMYYSKKIDEVRQQLEHAYKLFGESK